MRWRHTVLAIGALAGAILVLWGAVSTMSQQTARGSTRDAEFQGTSSQSHIATAGLLGSRNDDGELFVDIMGHTGDAPTYPMRCYFDASVALRDGEVGAIASPDAMGSIRGGEPVRDVPPGLEVGATIPGPVYLSEDGSVHAGYSRCEEVPR